jgi:hypothetical protein
MPFIGVAGNALADELVALADEKDGAYWKAVLP